MTWTLNKTLQAQTSYYGGFREKRTHTKYTECNKVQYTYHVYTCGFINNVYTRPLDVWLHLRSM